MARQTSAILAVLCAVFTATLSGCGPKEDPKATADAQSAFDAGRKAYEDGNWEEAAAQLSIALEIGGINPDHCGEARVKRAICNARVGKFADAHSDLDIAEQGADMAQVYVARSFVFRREGKPTEAAQALREAKTYDRSAKAIKE